MSATPTHILFFITKSVWGGAGRYVYDIATHLPRNEFIVTVAAAPGGELLARLEKQHIRTIPVLRFRRDVGMINDIRAGLAALMLLRKEQPDIIHVNSSKAGGVVGVAAVLARMFFGIRTKRIFTIHGWAFHEDRPPWQTLLIRFFSKLTAYCYHHIICVSEYDYTSLLRQRVVPPKKLITIHNGISPEDVALLSHDGALTRLGKYAGTSFTNSDILIGTIGELHQNKQPLLLLKTVRVLEPQPHVKIVIIGEGEERAVLREYIEKHGLRDAVFLLGNIPDAARLLRAFTIFAFPSQKEGLPYVLLEAGIAMLPVVASRVGGIPEIIEHKKSGLLLDIKKTASPEKELAEVIAQLLDNRTVGKNYGAALHQKVITEFNIKQMMDKTTLLYQQNL